MGKVIDITPFRRDQIDFDDAVKAIGVAIDHIRLAKEKQDAFLLLAGLEEADAAFQRLREFRRRR